VTASNIQTDPIEEIMVVEDKAHVSVFCRSYMDSAHHSYLTKLSRVVVTKLTLIFCVVQLSRRSTRLRA
jgi:hypothetical protein